MREANCTARSMRRQTMTARVTDTTGSMGGGYMVAGVSYAAGQIIDGRLICGAKKKNLDPCGASPVQGASRCGNHGGKAPQVQAKARERIIEENARGILGRIDPTAPMTHPVETLMKLISMKWAEVIWLRSKVQELDDEDLTWGRTQHETGVGPEGPIDKETYKSEVHVWWKLLRESENQLANWTAAAAKAGVDERLAKVTEDTANEFHKALTRILEALELTTDQRAKIPEVVPRILRSIAG